MSPGNKDWPRRLSVEVSRTNTGGVTEIKGLITVWRETAAIGAVPITADELTEGANPSKIGASEEDTVLSRTEGENRTELTLTRGPASTAA